MRKMLAYVGRVLLKPSVLTQPIIRRPKTVRGRLSAPTGVFPLGFARQNIGLCRFQTARHPLALSQLAAELGGIVVGNVTGGDVSPFFDKLLPLPGSRSHHLCKLTLGH